MYNSTKIIRYIENLCLIFIYFITKNVPSIVYLDSLLFTLFFEFVMNLRHILTRVKVVKNMQYKKCIDFVD